MKNYITILTVSLIVLLSNSSCQKTDNQSYTIPTTYNFENVGYTGQTQRINMLKELATYTKSANTAGSNQLSAIAMINIYNNSNAPFSDANLNTSGKQLKDKVATAMQNEFENYMTAQETASLSTNQTAMANQAGIITSNDGLQSFLINENGVELAQIIEKGLAVACLYYQSTVVYLGETKINVDNKSVTVGIGTNMEHHWDEAFGYFGAPIDFPGNISNLELWAKYSNKVNAVIGCNSKIMNAFLKGRAAITADDYDTRDAARETIKTEWEMILAAVAISYLNDAKDSSADPALCYHYLTKAYAFIMGLKYGASKTISDTDIDNILSTLAGSSNPLQANFYNTAAQDIDNAINAIANTFNSLEAVKASL
jgi:hypothetical protein